VRFVRAVVVRVGEGPFTYEVVMFCGDMVVCDTSPEIPLSDFIVVRVGVTVVEVRVEVLGPCISIFVGDIETLPEFVSGVVSDIEFGKYCPSTEPPPGPPVKKFRP